MNYPKTTAYYMQYKHFSLFFKNGEKKTHVPQNLKLLRMRGESLPA